MLPATSFGPGTGSWRSWGWRGWPWWTRGTPSWSPGWNAARKSVGSWRGCAIAGAPSSCEEGHEELGSRRYAAGDPALLQRERRGPRAGRLASHRASLSAQHDDRGGGPRGRLHVRDPRGAREDPRVPGRGLVLRRDGAARPGAAHRVGEDAQAREAAGALAHGLPEPAAQEPRPLPLGDPGALQAPAHRGRSGERALVPAREGPHEGSAPAPGPGSPRGGRSGHPAAHAPADGGHDRHLAGDGDPRGEGAEAGRLAAPGRQALPGG